MMMRILVLWFFGMCSCSADVLEEFFESVGESVVGLNQGHPRVQSIDAISSEPDRQKRLEMALSYMMEKNTMLLEEEKKLKAGIAAQILSVDCSHLKDERKKGEVLEILLKLMSENAIEEIAKTEYGYRIRTSAEILIRMSDLIVRYNCKVELVAWYFVEER